MQHLPVDDRLYPVPFFVEWIDGKPDFRVTSDEKRITCWKQRLCWLCGEPLGKTVAIVIGPMCAITRTTMDPPSHRECSYFAVRACPFLTLPGAHRRDANLPSDAAPMPGCPIERNPGVCCLWVTRNPTIFKDGKGSFLFNVGDPVENQVDWYAQGRPATIEEIRESIESGLPILQASAREDGPEAEDDLRERVRWVNNNLLYAMGRHR